eukprot:8179450-Prorocentrum_lima.AAC.1
MCIRDRLSAAPVGCPEVRAQRRALCCAAGLVAVLQPCEVEQDRLGQTRGANSVAQAVLLGR